MDKRQFLTGAALLASSPALAQAQLQKPGTDELGRTLGTMQAKPIPRRKARTTELFLTPPCWPNAIAADPQGRGFWIQQQRHDKGVETAWLLDRKGKVLHSLVTECVDCSGMTVGNGFVWSGANGASVHNPPDPPVEGVFQTDMNSKTISHRQIPFGTPRTTAVPATGLAWENADGGAAVGFSLQPAGSAGAHESRHLGMRFHVSRRRVSTGCMASKSMPQLHRWQVYGTQDPKGAGL